MSTCPNCGCTFASRLLSVRETPDARDAAIQECIAVARNIAGPFVSPTAEEIIAALTALASGQGTRNDNASTK